MDLLARPALACAAALVAVLTGTAWATTTPLPEGEVVDTIRLDDVRTYEVELFDGQVARAQAGVQPAEGDEDALAGMSLSMAWLPAPDGETCTGTTDDASQPVGRRLSVDSPRVRADEATDPCRAPGPWLLRVELTGTGDPDLEHELTIIASVLGDPPPSAAEPAPTASEPDQPAPLEAAPAGADRAAEDGGNNLGTAALAAGVLGAGVALRLRRRGSTDDASTDAEASANVDG